MTAAFGWLVLALAMAAWGGEAEADDVSAWQVRGTVRSGFTGREPSYQKVDFELYFDSRNRWQLELLRPIRDGAIVMTNREVSSFDGTNVFRVVYQPLRLRDQPDGTVVSSGVNSMGRDGHHFGSVLPLNTLPGCGPEGDFIWFAFLAAEVLKGDGPRPFPTILGDEAERPGGHNYDLTFRRKPGSRWIEQAAWGFNADYVTRNPWLDHPEILAPETQREAAAYDALVDELTGAGGRFSTIFRIEEFARSEGGEFPRRFRLDRRSENASTDHESAHFFREATVASYQPVELRQNDRPLLLGTVWVEDRRFRVRDASLVRNWIRYPIDDQRWILDTNDARLRAVAFVKPAFAPPKDRAQAWRWLVRALFLASLLVPVGLFWRRRQNRFLPAHTANNKHQEQTH